MAMVLKNVGFWNPVDSEGPAISPRELIDEDWAKDERAELVRYLNGGARVYEMLGFADNAMTGEESVRELGNAARTDGVWIWPEGLSVYVDRYRVRLPDAFLEHARSSGFRNPLPPKVDERAIEADPSFWFQWCEQQKATARSRGGHL